MASFSARRRFARRVAGFCITACFLLAGEALLAAPAVNGGAGYTHEIQEWIEESARNPAAAASVVTVIVGADPGPAISSIIGAQGDKLRYRWGRLHEVFIPAGKLAALAAHSPAGTVVRPPYPLGFASLANAQASGDMPSNLTITDYSGTGTGGIDHGTNVAEIVYDMAPGAQLYLAKINTDVQLQQAMTDMATAGVSVINHSVGWYGAAFYDGTGPLCDITNQAQQKNVQWVNAAGNDRYGHYMGTFTDVNGDLRHEFAVGQNYDTINLTSGSQVQFILNWDAYPTTSIDYNLYLYSGNPDTGGVVVAESATGQRGTASSIPYESIMYTPSTSGTYYIVVKKYQSSTTNIRFALFSAGANLGVTTNASSIVQPADCASVISAGATNLSDAPESFSAEGPTTDGRAKPDVSGPDRVQTSFYSSFCRDIRRFAAYRWCDRPAQSAKSDVYVGSN